jgi:SAM-dependent methyltransferase
VRRLLRAFTRADRLSKEQHELDWQRRWAALYQQPGVKEKCLEYWRTHRFLDDIRRRVDMEGRRVLDVGCGISTVLEFLPGRRTGIDPLGGAYARMHRYSPGIDVVAACGEAIPFAAGAFDVVFCSNVIDHTSDPPRVVREVERVLRPGGHFILTVECFPDEEEGRVRNAGHPHNITVRRLESLIAGFTVLLHEQSPWVGLRRYVEGLPPTGRREHILLLRRSEAGRAEVAHPMHATAMRKPSPPAGGSLAR